MTAMPTGSRGATHRLLGALAANRRIQEGTGADIDAEHPVSINVVWLIKLGATIAAMNTLNLAGRSKPLSAMLIHILSAAYIGKLVAESRDLAARALSAIRLLNA